MYILCAQGPVGLMQNKRKKKERKKVSGNPTWHYFFPIYGLFPKFNDLLSETW